MRVSMRVATLILALLFASAFSLSAIAKRRAVSPCRSCTPPPKFVKVALGDIMGEDKNHEPIRWLFGLTTEPVSAGDSYHIWLQKPGEEWAHKHTTRVEPGGENFYIVFNLYDGNEFYDEMEGGARQYWNPGIGRFRIDAEYLKGEKTTSLLQFEVGIESAARVPFGPLLDIVPAMPDGRTLQLIGNFSTPPVVVFVEKVFVEGLGTVAYFHYVKANANNVVKVPDRISGNDVPVIVGSGYSGAEFSTTEVDIPSAAANTQSLLSADEVSDDRVIGPFFMNDPAIMVVSDAQPPLTMQ